MSKVSEQLRVELVQLQARAYALRAQYDQVEQLVRAGQSMLAIALKAEEAKDEELAQRIDADIAAEVQP